MQYKDIAHELGDFTELQVKGWINNHCPKKLRTFNDSYFNNITTSNQAYWLGFIFADGSIVCNPKTRNYELTIELNCRDRYILEIFNKELGEKHQIIDRIRTDFICNYKHETKRTTSRIRIYSKRIVEDLINNNVVPNKTYRPEFPIVSDDLFWDFVRGYFDGDGCVYVNHEKPITKSSVHFTSAREEVLKYLQSRFKNDYKIDSKIYQESDRKYRLMIITYDNIIKFLENIYYSDDITMLNRKYEKYKELALLGGNAKVINRAKSKKAC